MTAIDEFSDVTKWTPAPNMAAEFDASLHPQLSSKMIEVISQRGMCSIYQPGDVLLKQDQKDAPFFVIIKGQCMLFDRTSKNSNEYFAKVSDGMFVGDTTMFTGMPTVAECRAFEQTKVLQLNIEGLRDLVRSNSEIGDLILQTLINRRAWMEGHGVGRIQLIGPQRCPNTYKMREFLGRNQVLFDWIDPQTKEEFEAIIENLELKHGDFPVIITSTGTHRNPDIQQVAKYIGLLPELEDKVYDMAVIGAGPGGLAASVYGASEGLSTVVLDASSPGGQASTSSKIENYLGFATGISGSDLAAQAVIQAKKFGATICNPISVKKMELEGHVKKLTLSDDRELRASTVVLSMGAKYRKLEGTRCEDFEGNGVYYAAGHLESGTCKNSNVAIVGGGNSAGQAAVFMAKHAAKVYIIIRRDSLSYTMSQYLIDRIEKMPNIELITKSQIQCVGGNNVLESIELDSQGKTRHLEVKALFVMIGAAPNTSWLDDCIGKDQKGFILTGSDTKDSPDFEKTWNLERDPYLLETTVPGVFAVGDVRSGSIKRVAASDGDGSMSVSFVHQVIAEQKSLSETA